jgi:hypothetical protein
MVERIISSQSTPPVCLWQENPNGLVSLYNVLEFTAGRFMETLAAIHRLEKELETNTDRAKLDRWMQNVKSAYTECETLGMTSSATQAQRALALWDQNNPASLVREHVQDLLRRIRDDMFGISLYRILPDKGDFLVRDPSLSPMGWSPTQIRRKSPLEYFGTEIVKRFPAIHTDLAEAIKCYIFECRPACVFHLMRATEIGIPKLAKMCEIKDRSPSWGTVLTQAEKYTQKTEFKDLPDHLKPLIEFLRFVVADMRSLQRAWRNKVSHVEDKLILADVDGIESNDAYQIMIATRTFLERLAKGLPDGC